MRDNIISDMKPSVLRITAREAKELTERSTKCELDSLYSMIRVQCKNGETTYTWFPRDEMNLHIKEDVAQQLRMDGYSVGDITKNGARIISWKG